MGVKTNKEVNNWIQENKRVFNLFKSMPLKHLQLLGKQAGLEMNHYKTKSLISKGLMIRLGSVLPVEFEKWK